MHLRMHEAQAEFQDQQLGELPDVPCEMECGETDVIDKIAAFNSHTYIQDLKSSQ